MFKRTLFIISILALALVSCAGKEAPPTTSPADIQNTAISSASTIMAATQMAAPTATLVPPPTDTPIPFPTPLPTFTPDLSLPTLAPPSLQPSPTTASSTTLGGECNKLLDLAEAGPAYPVRIQNQSGGSIILSLYLSTNEFGQCGYMPGVSSMQGSQTVQLPTGNWYFFALIDYGNNKSGNYSGYFTVQSGGTAVVQILRK